MKAYRWLGHDRYEYLLSCNKEEAFSIIAHFGPDAKARTIPFTETRKISLYFLSTCDKIITPVRYPSGLGAHAGDNYIGEERTLAVFLDDYHLEESPR